MGCKLCSSLCKFSVVSDDAVDDLDDDQTRYFAISSVTGRTYSVQTSIDGTVNDLRRAL